MSILLMTSVLSMLDCQVFLLMRLIYQRTLDPSNYQPHFIWRQFLAAANIPKKINATLAAIAAQTGIAMAVGSQSVALSDPSLRDTFKIVRQVNPDGPIFANIGANRSVTDALAAVKMISADALEVHINTAQELIMPEGDREFHFTENIAEIIAKLQVPVIVKEVGFGISQETIHQLINMGVKYINVSGRGGTDFAKIENFRRHSKDMGYLENWGLTTTESLLESRQFQNQATMIASGALSRH